MNLRCQLNFIKWKFERAQILRLIRKPYRNHDEVVTAKSTISQMLHDRVKLCLHEGSFSRVLNKEVYRTSKKILKDIESILRVYDLNNIGTSAAVIKVDFTQKTPPRFGERLLLLILTKDERVNIPGDLEEEFAQIATKHGARFANLWYYKQVAASAWPMIRKAVRWGLLASLGEWIRRLI